jgi:chromosome segregation ATPase
MQRMMCSVNSIQCWRAKEVHFMYDERKGHGLGKVLLQNRTIMRTTNIIMLSLAVAASGLVACSEQPDGADQMESEVDKAMEDMRREREELAQEFRELRAEMNARLAEVDNKLNDPSLTAEARVEWEAEKEELNEQMDRVDGETSKLENATKETWNDVKHGTRNTIDDIGNWFERQAEKVDRETDADTDKDGH